MSGFKKNWSGTEYILRITCDNTQHAVVGKEGDKEFRWDLVEEENGPSKESTPELQLVHTLKFVQRALFVTFEY